MSYRQSLDRREKFSYTVLDRPWTRHIRENSCVISFIFCMVSYTTVLMEKFEMIHIFVEKRMSSTSTIPLHRRVPEIPSLYSLCAFPFISISLQEATTTWGQTATRNVSKVTKIALRDVARGTFNLIVIFVDWYAKWCQLIAIYLWFLWLISTFK